LCPSHINHIFSLVLGQDLGESGVELLRIDSLDISDGLENIREEVKFESQLSEAILAYF
jgi:hypothetical protein